MCGACCVLCGVCTVCVSGIVLAQKDPRLSVCALFVYGKLGATGSFQENPETQGVRVRPVLYGTGLNLFCVTERALITRRGSKFQNVVRKICTKSFAKPYGQIYGQLEIDGLQSDAASRLV